MRTDTEERVSIKLLHECFLWGLLGAATELPDTSKEAFRRDLMEGTLPSLVLPELSAPARDLHLCAMRFLGQCFGSLASAASKSIDSATIANAVIQQLAAVVTDAWIADERQEEVLPVVCAFYEELVSVMDLNESPRSFVIESLASPIGRYWTERAFLQDSVSVGLFASHLLKASRILKTCLVQFPEREAAMSGIAPQTMKEIQTLFCSGSHKIETLDTHCDLLIYLLSQEPTENRTQQWKMILTSLTQMIEIFPEAAPNLAHRLLLQLHAYLTVQDLDGLQVKEIEAFCEAFVKKWMSTSLATASLTLCIRLQRSLLSSSSYALVLQWITDTSLKKAAESADLESALLELLETLFSPAAVCSVHQEISDLWLDLAVRIVLHGWNQNASHSRLAKISSAAWNEGHSITEIQKDLVQELSRRLQQSLIHSFEQSHVSESICAMECGAVFAKRALQLIHIQETDTASFLETMFDGGHWCVHWEQTGNLKTQKTHQMYGIYIATAQELIRIAGAPVVKSSPKLTGPLFLEILLQETDDPSDHPQDETSPSAVHGIPEVQRAIVEEIVKDVVERQDTSLAQELLERDICSSLSSHLPVGCVHGSAAGAILESLSEHSDVLSVLSLLEKISALLAQSVTCVTAIIENEERDEEDTELVDLNDQSFAMCERFLHYLSILAPIFRSLFCQCLCC